MAPQNRSSSACTANLAKEKRFVVLGWRGDGGRRGLGRVLDILRGGVAVGGGVVGHGHGIGKAGEGGRRGFPLFGKEKNGGRVRRGKGIREILEFDLKWRPKFLGAGGNECFSELENLPGAVAPPHKFCLYVFNCTRFYTFYVIVHRDATLPGPKHPDTKLPRHLVALEPT
ncbi:hypothetical protein BHE74_00018204 [Ensete ventricosum]|nr:hypothetical protein GW17_00015745 [Ensete ventricosum]RWW73877.1 hypothetical protein BHE74_00018204 [Ensete ventricosum]RZR97234.1 hypothetical protein BHM03_00026373 [Ensete ventricosum]